jgi:hypothetical protein
MVCCVSTKEHTRVSRKTIFAGLRQMAGELFYTHSKINLGTFVSHLICLRRTGWKLTLGYNPLSKKNKNPIYEFLKCCVMIYPV